MESIREHARLIYDLFAFNFEIEGWNATCEVEGLGANLPTELFPQILYWLKHTDPRRKMLYEYQQLPKEPPEWKQLIIFEEIQMANPLYALRNCALVSRYWANLCRAYIFGTITLHFKTLAEARLFRQYTTQGSPNLVPLYKLIGGLSVTQDYSGLQRSFLDLVYTSHLRGKLKELRITGPLPYGSLPLKLDSPHWGIVNTALLPPTVTAYSTVNLKNLRFPSFSYALRYLGYFRSASHIDFSSIDWDSNDKVFDFEPLYLSRPKPNTPHERVTFTATGGTDACLLAWHSSTMYSDSPIHTLVSRQQCCMLQIVNFIHQYCRKLDGEHGPGSSRRIQYSFDYGIHHNSRLPQFVLGLEGYIRLTLSFVFNSRPPTPDITSRGSPRPMRIIATIIQVYPLNTESESQANSGYDDCAIFAYLRRQLEELCTLRSVVLSFPDHKTLQRVTNYVASLRDPWRNVTCVYRFVCQDDMQDPLPVNPYRPHFNSSSGGIRYDHSYEIIPATLELTGNRARLPEDLVTTLISG